MIAKMRKLNLAALSYDRDGVLNVLNRTYAVEVKEHEQKEGLSPVDCGGEELLSYLNSLEASLEILVSAAVNSAKNEKEGKALQKDGFSVTYEEFISAADYKERADEVVATVNALTDKKNGFIAEQARLARAIAAASAYEQAKLPFDAYADTLHTKTRLGIMAPAAWDGIQKSLGDIPLADYEAVRGAESVLVTVIAHNSVFAEVESLLGEAGFTQCPYRGNLTGAQQLNSLKEQLKQAQEGQREAEEATAALASEIRKLKIYCDYVSFQIDKSEATGKMRGTEHTFFLEAFVPADAEQLVKDELEKSGITMWYEFSDPAEDEEVPTLMRNNAVVSNFEAITNMYSPPNAREFDPNTVMGFFYSLFLGFIMGDVGYGILMLFGGGALWLKSRKGTGIHNLAGVFAIGGIFTIMWGFLFNSLFGIQILPYTVMPDAQSGMYTFMGIQIPAVLVIAMLLGISHLLVGYFCKAFQEWRQGHVLDGIFDGLTWTFFALGTALAIAGMVEEFNLPQILVWIGGIMAGVSLLLAAVTAGRHEKIIGKFTKGFGSVYGIINYVSDILSYARLYGLMLSGAIIAQIVSKYSIQFITGGNVAFAILGVVLMVVGHVFNIAIGLLGAYIHDARLQYVEFYGRFYTGEGELFTPLGSVHKHVYIDKKK